MSSIKVVFPLDSTFKTNYDSPKLLLNLKERAFIPIKKSNNDFIYVNEIEKLDKYNRNVELSTNDIEENTDIYSIKGEISTFVHKPIAVSIKSSPQFKKDFNGNYTYQSFSYSSSSRPSLYVVRTYSNVNNTELQNYFMGPYLNDTIAYRKFDNDGNSTFVNVSSPLSFYTKFEGKVYNLFDIINYRIDNERSLSSSLNGIDNLFYNYYIKPLFKNLDDSIKNNLSGNSASSFYFPFYRIIETTNEYQPDGYDETCNFMGLKFYPSEKITVTSGQIHGHNSSTSTLTDLTTTIVNKYFKNYGFSSINNAISRNFQYCNIYSNDIYTKLSGIFITNKISNPAYAHPENLFYQAIKYQINEKLSFKIVCPANMLKIAISKKSGTRTYSYSVTANLSGNTVKGSQIGLSGTLKNKTYKAVSSIVLSQDSINENLPETKYFIGNDAISSNLFSTILSYYPYNVNAEESLIEGTHYPPTGGEQPTSRSIPSSCFQNEDAITTFNNFITRIIENLTTKNHNEIEKANTTNGKIDNDPNLTVDNIISGTKLLNTKSTRIKNLFVKKDNTFYVQASSAQTSILFNKTNLSEDKLPQRKDSVIIINSDSSQYAFLTGPEPYNVLLQENLKSSTNANEKRYIKWEDLKTTFEHFYSMDGIDYAQLPSSFKNYSNLGNTNTETGFIKYGSFNTGSAKNIGSFSSAPEFYSIEKINSIIQTYDIILTSVPTSSSVSYDLKSLFIKDNNGVDQKYVISGMEDYEFYVYPGKRLDTVSVNDGESINTLLGHLDINLTNNKYSFIPSSILNEYDESQYDNLKLYYDENCIKPIRILYPGNSMIQFYSMSERGKSIYLNAQKKGSLNTDGTYKSFNYLRVYDYEYERSKIYAFDTVKDWYNINAYVDCKKILNYFDKNYQLRLTGGYWESDYLVDDRTRYSSRAYIGHKSTNKLQIVNKVSTNSIISSNLSLSLSAPFRTHINAIKNGGIGEFRSGDQEKNFSYKLFSFNFKIPKWGWDKLDEIMYAPNPYFKTNILTNGEKNSILEYIKWPSGYNSSQNVNYNPIPVTPLSALQGLSSSHVIFNGEMSFIYLVLDSKVSETVVGSGNKGTGKFKAGSYSYTGAKIDESNVQMGGKAERKLEDAYIATHIRIPFVGKLKDGGTTLVITSPNNTLAFTVDFSENDIMDTVGGPSAKKFKRKEVTISGIHTTVEVNDVIHNVIIPKLVLQVYLGWTESGNNKSKYVLSIIPYNEYYKVRDTGFINSETSLKGVKTLQNHNCQNPLHTNLTCKICRKYIKDHPEKEKYNEVAIHNSIKNKLIKAYEGSSKVTITQGDKNTTKSASIAPFDKKGTYKYSNCFYHLWQNMAASLDHDENFYFYTWIPLCFITFGTPTDEIKSSIINAFSPKNSDNLFSPISSGKLDVSKLLHYYFINEPNTIELTLSSNTNFTSTYENLSSDFTTSAVISANCTRWTHYGNNIAIHKNPFYEYQYNVYRGLGRIDGKSSDSTDNEYKLKDSIIYDAEELVMPRDISTNLFYYKGSNENTTNEQDRTDIRNGDEVIIINARKMYSEPDNTDERPISSNLRLSFESLKDQDVILTSRIIGSEEDILRYFNEVHVFVNNDLTYERDNKKGYRECRYTDAHSEGLQWKLFELQDNIRFETIDGFEAPMTKVIGSTSGNDIINVPCKMTISLSGLIFQQQCRYGVKFDNIDNVLFDQQVFDGSVFGITGAIDSKYIRSTIKNNFNLLRIGEKSTIETGQVPSAVIKGVVKNNTNYYLIKRPTEDLESSVNAIGGSKYYNDFYDMKINKNAANKWKTYTQKSRLSKLLVYPDYSPGPVGRIVGTPYLNQESTIVLREKFNEGTSTSTTNGVEHQIDSLANLVKIAKDISYVDPVLNVDSIDDIPVYPSALQNVTIKFLNPSIGIYQSNDEGVFGNNGVLLYKVEISGTIGHYDTYINNIGAKYFNFGDHFDRKSGQAFVSIPNDVEEPNQIGIYFDGLDGEKEIILKNNYTGFKINTTATDTKYYILGLNSSKVSLKNDNGIGVFRGYITIQLTAENPETNGSLIEIHNFKLPSPILTYVGVSFTDDQQEDTDSNGYYTIDDEIWQSQVYLRGNAALDFISEDNDTNYNNYRLYSSAQPGSELSGNSSIEVDDDGNVSALLLTIKIPGFKLFKSAGMKYFLESEETVTLSSSQMLSTYRKTFGIKDSKTGKTYLLGDYYNPNAVVGSQVLSGTISNTYNYVTTTSLPIKFNTGIIKYKYNPPENDRFQLEVITKSSGGKFKKNLYYINRPVDKWYNMAFYKTVTTSESGDERDATIHFLLNDVDSESISDISSTPGEIFRCFVSNDSIIEGSTIKFNLGSTYSLGNTEWINALFPKIGSDNKILSLMKSWKSLYDIEFDKCQRTQWSLYFSNDPQLLSNSDEETEIEYEEKGRKNIDLFKISDSLNGLNFSNKYGNIKLFANAELGSVLSTKEDTYSNNKLLPITLRNWKYGSRPLADAVIPFYNFYTGPSYDAASYVDFIDLTAEKINGTFLRRQSTWYAAFLREILTTCYPRKVLFDNSDNSYILKRRPISLMSPIIKGVGLEVSNIMFISTPNLSYKRASSTDEIYGGAYTETYFESLGAVREYEDFFGNPQHRLPPVSYKTKLLDSSYATFIYNNIEKYDAIENYVSSDKAIEEISYSYDKNPSKIAVVWGNSQVTRSESSFGNSEYSSKLYWNKIAFNEYTSEVGSVYNYTNSQSVTNISIVETGSIVDRQCVLMPVVNSPLEYEARSTEKGVIKVNDNIIATAALGYTSTGYPKNGILLYNTNGNVTIDSTLKNYIYIEQSNTSNDCNLGTTIQKPVFTEVINQNIESLAEKLTFLPNPTISNYNSKNLNDEGVNAIEGGNVGNNLGSIKDAKIFYNGSTIGISGNYDNLRKSVYINQVLMDEVSIYKYPTDNSIETVLSSNGKFMTYFINPFSVSTLSGDNTIVDTDSFNVFYDESKLDQLSANVKGVNVSTSLHTLKCFDFEGNLINILEDETDQNSPAALFNANYKLNTNSSSNEYSNIINSYISLSKAMENESETLDIDLAPIFGVIWSNESYIENSDIYESDMKINLYDYSANRLALLDEYFGANISCVRFKIKEENIKSAPIYIQIKMLKYDENEHRFKWYHHPSYDFDITETYEAVYDYDNPGDRTIEKTFVDDGTGYMNHIYGIKFKIMKIVPQQELINECIIDNVQIFCANILNKNGISKSIEDVYIRRADAYYINEYPIKCSEYIWRLPNTGAEWNSVFETLKADTSLETKNALPVISGYIQNFINGTSNNIDAKNYLSTQNFSRVNSYFITNQTNQNNVISEVLSDNYLVDSDIRISWKYVDYVYIYYSCYSFNAKELLDMYFGDKIYAAVRSKLINNVNNLNLNSAFKEKYKFGGGIAVQKEYSLNAKRNSQVFQWKADVRYNQKDTYQDYYNVTYKTTDVYSRDVLQRKATSTTNIIQWGRGIGSAKVTGTIKETVTQQKLGKAKVTSSTTKVTNVKYVGTEKVDTKTTRDYLGSTLQNAKYSSVDNWTKSFSPRQIKYKIN